ARDHWQKKLARNRFQASSLDFRSYVGLVPMPVVMMTMVAVNPMPIVPVVRGTAVIGVRIWLRIIVRPVVPIWVISTIPRVAIIAARESNPTSADSDRNLSVRTLHGNESQSTYHQCNQEKLFHVIFPSCLLLCER